MSLIALWGALHALIFPVAGDETGLAIAIMWPAFASFVGCQLLVGWASGYRRRKLLILAAPALIYAVALGFCTV